MGEQESRGLLTGGSNTTRSFSNQLPEVVPTGLPPRLRLQMSEGRASFELNTSQPFIIGRTSSSGAVEVDLSPYNADDLGISRKHVRLEPLDERLMVRDLDSVNGSSLNGRPLTPNQPYQVHHGDELKIGRLKMRIFFLFTG